MAFRTASLKWHRHLRLTRFEKRYSHSSLVSDLKRSCSHHTPLISTCCGCLQSTFHTLLARVQLLNPKKRTAASFFSFIVMQDCRTEMCGSNLPMHNVKVYFPMAFLEVLRNCARVGFHGSWNLRAPGPSDVKVTMPKEGAFHYSITTLRDCLFWNLINLTQ